MQLEGMALSPHGADVGELRWSNDGAQMLGVDDLLDLFSTLCSEA